MKRAFVFSLGLSLLVVLIGLDKAQANQNALVDGMVTMMENLGLVDPARLPLGTHYLPSAGAMSPYGFGNVPGMSPFTGLSGVPGMTPFTGLGGVPGINPMTGLGSMPGTNPMMGLGGMPGGWPGGTGFNFPGQAPWNNPGQATLVPGLLDGVWELNNGTFVIIKADSARLYVAADQYQDFLLRYDDKHFWWRPRDGSKFQRYRYEMREGRMVLADDQGRLLLLRRRR